MSSTSSQIILMLLGFSVVSLVLAESPLAELVNDLISDKVATRTVERKLRKEFNNDLDLNDKEKFDKYQDLICKDCVRVVPAILEVEPKLRGETAQSLCDDLSERYDFSTRQPCDLLDVTITSFSQASDAYFHMMSNLQVCQGLGFCKRECKGITTKGNPLVSCILCDVVNKGCAFDERDETCGDHSSIPMKFRVGTEKACLSTYKPNKEEKKLLITPDDEAGIFVTEVASFLQKSLDVLPPSKVMSFFKKTHHLASSEAVSLVGKIAGCHTQGKGVLTKGVLTALMDAGDKKRSKVVECLHGLPDEHLVSAIQEAFKAHPVVMVESAQPIITSNWPLAWYWGGFLLTAGYASGGCEW